MDDDKSRLIGSLEIVTGVGVVLYWLAFFAVGLVPENAGPAYFQHRYSFIAGDVVLVVLLIWAGVLLMRGKRAGIFLSMMAGAILIYAGLIDVLFNFLYGVYLASSVDLAVNAAANLWCIGFGVAAIVISRKLDVR